MLLGSRLTAAVVATSLLLLPVVARAQAPADPPSAASPASEPAGAPVDVPPSPQAPTYAQAAPVTVGSPDDAHARKTLTIFAAQERSGRLLGGYAALLSGASAVGAGVLADVAYDQAYGQPVWILGIAVGAVGLVSLFRPGPIESLEKSSVNASAEQVHGEWSRRAEAAKSARQLGGIVNLALGVIAGGVGGAIAGGAGDLDQSQKEGWSVTLIGASGVLLGSGITSLLLESPAEVGFRAAYGEVKPPIASLSIAPTPSGGSMGIQGRF